MEMIVIYDNTGHIYYCAGGDVTEPQGLPFIKVTVPSGKRLKSVDVTGDIPVPVFEDLPESNEAKLEARISNLEQLIADQDNAIVEIASMVEGREE